jgi:acyl carrier protein
MRERLAELLELGVADVDVEIPIERYGIDSRTLASLAGELEDWLDCQLPATLLWDYSTIREVSAAIGAIVEGRSR